MITDPELEELAVILREVLGKYREKFGDPPYNFYIHSSPTDGSEYPYYHWHIELLPKLTTPGGFELGTSMMINVTTPEHAADHLTGRIERGMGAV
jgi:UDPglucose--hexose-1-phosphate uridylyltransferase